MPKNTTGGGSNAVALPGESGYIAPEVPEVPGAELSAKVDGLLGIPQPPVTSPRPAKAASAPPKAPPQRVTGSGGVTLPKAGTSGQ